MDTDLIDLYRRTSTWTNTKIAGATRHLDDATPCDRWNVRQLLAHMLDTQQYFLRSARGEKASPPAQDPPDILSADPVADFKRTSDDVLEVFGAPGVVEKTGPMLGIAFADLLLHGCDLARATRQDDTMPDGLATAAYDMIHGRFTEEQRKGVFKPEVTVWKGASPQERLLAYTGRQPN